MPFAVPFPPVLIFTVSLAANLSLCLSILLLLCSFFVRFALLVLPSLPFSFPANVLCPPPSRRCPGITRVNFPKHNPGRITHAILCSGIVYFRRLVFLVLFVSSIVFGRQILCSSYTVRDMFIFCRPILFVRRAMASIKKNTKPIRKQTIKDNWLNYYHMHRNFRLLPFLYFASVVLYPVNSVNTLKVMTQLSLSCFGYNIAN